MTSLADYAMIANSVKDDVLTPTETGIQNQQLKNLALNNRGQEMKINQAQKQIDSDAMVKQLIQKNTVVDPATNQIKVNHGQVAADLANSGNVDKAYEYMDQQHKATWEKNRQSVEQVVQLAQSVLSQPDEVRPQAYQSALMQAKNLGIDVSGAPPEYDPNYLTGIINQGIDAKTHFESTQRSQLEDKKIEADKQKALMKGNEEKPYHTTFSTADGMFDFDSRTGVAKKILTAEGKPVVKDTADVGLQTNLEKSKVTGKNEAARVDAAAKAENLSGQLLSNIDEARTLLKSGATGSLIGAARDKAMGVVGATTDAGKLASQLETLSGWMTANVPRMEGPQSNVDVESYKTMAARVGDKTIPVPERLSALDTLEKLQKKYSKSNQNIISTQAVPTVQGGSGVGTTPGIAPTVSNW